MVEYQRDGYLISTDRARLDVEFIHQFLSNSAYWAQGRPLVTGASRGAGRRIAQVLGEQGATVHVTGRSARGGPATEVRTGTIDQTAEMVTARGGVGIPVRCDHTVDAEVKALLDRVEQEQGRLDLLVNNVWGGYERYGDADFDAPFWEQPLWRWDRMFDAGVRAHNLASRQATPIMMAQGSGLMINTTFWDRGKCLSGLHRRAALAPGPRSGAHRVTPVYRAVGGSPGC